MRNLKRTIFSDGPNPPPAESPDKDWVRAQFRAAVRALMALPLTARDKPQALRAGWPEVVRTRDDWFAAMIGASEEQRAEMAGDRLRLRRVATAEDFAALDRCVVWLLAMPKDWQMVMIGRGIGIPAKRIAERLHCSRQHVYDVEDEAIGKILAGYPK